MLEANSCYAYLVLCQDFRDTCVVAEIDGSLVGYVVGYCPPARPDSLFVWQIGVSGRVRKQGLGTRMLLELIQRSNCSGCLEATITPSNLPSRKMFEAVARELSVPFEYLGWFESEDFEATDSTQEDQLALEHEPEQLIRIGPLSSKAEINH